MTPDTIPPLYLDLSGDGEAELDAAMTYLTDTQGIDYAVRFTGEVGLVTRETCERVAAEIAEYGKVFDRTDEGASLRFAAPVYRVDVLVGKSRARRSSAGLWYVFYTLVDRAGIGRPDTMYVVAVRHSASRPFRVEDDADDER